MKLRCKPKQKIPRITRNNMQFAFAAGTHEARETKKHSFLHFGRHSFVSSSISSEIRVTNEVFSTTKIPFATRARHCSGNETNVQMLAREQWQTEVTMTKGWTLQRMNEKYVRIPERQTKMLFAARHTADNNKKLKTPAFTMGNDNEPTSTWLQRSQWAHLIMSSRLILLHTRKLALHLSFTNYYSLCILFFPSFVPSLLVARRPCHPYRTHLLYSLRPNAYI